jgi:hypothetical protein
MSTPLEELRKEREDLSARATRFAIASLTLIAVSSLTFARALRLVDSNEVNTLFDKIGEAIFDRAASPERATIIHSSLAKISAAFTVELPLTGVHLPVNLLYWSPLLPFLILASLAYLAILSAKQNAVGMIAAGRIRSDETASPLDHLIFGSDAPPSYSRYPARLGGLLYVGVIVALMINVGVALATTFTVEAALEFAEFFRHLLIVCFYFWCVTGYVRRRILAEGAAIAGLQPRPHRQRLERLRTWVAARVRRLWRAMAFGGSGMMLASLFCATASMGQCSADVKGIELFRGKRGATWPPVDNLVAVEPIFRFDALGRYVYVGAIVFAIAAIVITAITTVPSVARRLAGERRLWDLARGAAVVIFFFVLCSFGFAWVFFVGLPALFPPLWQFVYWFIPSLLYVWMTVLQKQRFASRWKTEIRPALAVLYAPAWITFPVGLLITNVGSQLLSLGSLCLASAFVYGRMASVETGTETAPLARSVDESLAAASPPETLESTRSP